ncbi:MAG TPA: hypothetical protein VNM22_16065 [Candidatus Limnocylindrales bacterium]|nr:hypothetical protein [Candidatus Limnocylindrales bacterium]
MKKLYLLLTPVILLVLKVQAQNPPPLQLVQTIPLPHVEGRIDHLDVDLTGQRLFIAALGNNTLEILDLRAGKPAHSITGLYEPQGVTFIPEFNKIFVTNGQSGTCDIFDGNSFKLLQSIKSLDDADNIRYDATTQFIYIGYGDGALALVDAASGKYLGNIQLEGHPESFQLEKQGPRIFVNIPSAHHIAIVDREKRTVLAKWPLKNAQANFPMALDETHHRLFVGFRKPSKLIVFDTESGRIVTELNSVGDSDDIFYDPIHRRIYGIGGEGFIDVFEQKDADHYERVTKIPTASGARTGLFVPQFNRLYLAVSHRGNQKAEIWVYEVLG